MAAMNDTEEDSGTAPVDDADADEATPHAPAQSPEGEEGGQDDGQALHGHGHYAQDIGGLVQGLQVKDNTKAGTYSSMALSAPLRQWLETCSMAYS